MLRIPGSIPAARQLLSVTSKNCMFAVWVLHSVLGANSTCCHWYGASLSRGMFSLLIDWYIIYLTHELLTPRLTNHDHCFGGFSKLKLFSSSNLMNISNSVSLLILKFCPHSDTNIKIWTRTCPTMVKKCCVNKRRMSFGHLWFNITEEKTLARADILLTFRSSFV